MIYKLNGIVIDINSQHQIGQTVYPSGTLLMRKNEWAALGIIEEADPVPPAPTVADTVVIRLQELADLRYTKEIAGTVVNGASIMTDRESQSKIMGAWATMQISPATIINWKTLGGWISLNNTAIQAIASAVSAHVQACYSNEKFHSDALNTLLTRTVPAPATVTEVTNYNITTGWPV